MSPAIFHRPQTWIDPRKPARAADVLFAIVRENHPLHVFRAAALQTRRT